MATRGLLALFRTPIDSHAGITANVRRSRYRRILSQRETVIRFVWYALGISALWWIAYAAWLLNGAPL